MTNQTVVNQTKINNVNIRDVSHVSMVTSVYAVQPISTNAKLQLANPGRGYSQLHNYCQNIVSRLIDQPLLELLVGYKNTPNVFAEFTDSFIALLKKCNQQNAMQACLDNVKGPFWTFRPVGSAYGHYYIRPKIRM